MRNLRKQDLIWYLYRTTSQVLQKVFYEDYIIVRVLSGEVYDVAVDIRKGSKTYGKWFGVTLSAEKKNMFYIPEGFAHGFYVLSDTAEFAYKCTDFYDPSSEAGIKWDDPTIGVKWPIPEGTTPNISEKDGKHPAFTSEISLDY